MNNMEAQLDLKAIHEIMYLDDEEFENAVKGLDLREILCLMEALQTSMCDEQLQFEHLTRQLQMYPDRDSFQHRKISAALCTAQSLLTNLLTKHMICSGQRSLRSSFDEDHSSDTIKGHTMASLQNGRESGFKESLRFFQNQVNQADVPLSSRKSNGIIKSHGSSDDTKPKIGNTAPSVDNILSNVKTICSNRNAKYSNIKDYTDQSKLGSVVYQSSVNGIPRDSEGVTRSEQIISKVMKSTSEHSVKPSLLSNFNPSLEFDDDSTLKNNNATNLPFLSDNKQTKYSKESSVLLSEKNVSHNETVSLSKTVSKRSNLKEGTQILLNSEEKTDSKNLTNNRTFGQCKEKLAAHTPKQSPVRNIQVQLTGVPNRKTESSNIVEVSKKEDDTSESIESDYDSQDFVVHKATFPEDYLEAMSEDNYSSVNEEYEVELPHDPDIPSPDYASDEEEYLVQHSDVQEYDNVEFIDNSAQYANDPRRYIYYPDDKELEVIPEEDEDDIEDHDIYNNSDLYKKGGYSTDFRYNPLGGECDSGLTDDQRSSCSTAEECDLEDDTDSAKGSLHDSPTMFPNVEFHKTRLEKPKAKIFNGVDREDLPVRTHTGLWDPKELLEVLYRLDIPIETSKNPTRYINKEGYLDKLPSGRKKATYWNPWKTKYIKLKDGFLYCYDNNRADKASMTLQLMGGHIDTLENKMIGVDDQKGHYLVLRCSDDDEIESWENALRSQCAEDFNNAYTSPCLRPLSTSKNVIIIDFGSCSVRAGRLMSQPSLPQLFFPTVNAKNKSSGKCIFGIDALKPSIRKECSISFPLHPSAKVTKYSIDVTILPDLLKYIFKELNVYPEDYKVQLSMPRNLSLQTKIKIARMMLEDFKVKGVNLTHQAILSLHAYNSKSGIIVDIGDRLDVIPIIEGYIVESGVTRLPYGGLRMIHHLKHSLAEKNISVVSDIESYLARYVLEQLCYVAEDYNEELQRFYTTPDDFEMSISTSHFFNNDCFIDEMILDMARFHVPEGLFTPEKWGLDNPGLHKLVHHAIQECGVDLRKEMTKSIYVSGGLTLLPGFVERLEKEIDKLTPNTPKVHASNYRYHMSYIGACQIALEEKFEEVCIKKQTWRKEGNTCVKKWHI